MKRRWIGFLAMLACLATTAAPARDLAPAPAGAVDDARRGWHFYDDPLAPEPAAPIMPPRLPARDAAPPELARLKRLQREMEDLRAVAVIHPTEANVRRYMVLEAQVMRNASQFADLAQRIAWTHPELDPATQGRPVNATALDVYEQTQAATRADTLARVGRDHVLMFFFRSDCPYCHAFAPVLKAFGQRYRIPLVAVSLDGGALPALPAARVDNGIVRTLKVAQVPAVFLAQPFAGRIVPLGFGVLSESQLVERIVALQDRPGAGQGAPLFWPGK
ncbi:conjugal transfer protein TraF [Pseudoduganella violacea]|uniref:Conjugal transfer pilus assembly protein TraF n=1 Tax=Pseudoduganella violacea TaxID=1715466 RepID=A0A7W5FWM1_9BURK|nr:conjugal transfer protein TraF [Pseudoduganella violacea]MBB3122165.1 conjugal transfer pilus assembly protein TraF [Pseudoduganella violacea]